MAIDSSSTYDEVLSEYLDNADYDVTGSAAKCANFIRAIRFLLSPKFNVKRVSHGGRSGNEIELHDPATLKSQLDQALAWQAAYGAAANGGGVIHPDFTGFRD